MVVVPPKNLRWQLANTPNPSHEEYLYIILVSFLQMICLCNLLQIEDLAEAQGEASARARRPRHLRIAREGPP